MRRREKEKSPCNLIIGIKAARAFVVAAQLIWLVMETQIRSSVYYRKCFFLLLLTSGGTRQSTSCTLAIPCIEFAVARTAIWQDTEFEFLLDPMDVPGFLGHDPKRRARSRADPLEGA